jgi:CO/xanthine dehydrogenase Mo-binding subunit
LTLGFYLPASGKEPGILTTETAESLGIELNAWISIDTSGKVTITNHRSEMGQGSYQSVPQIIAEELGFKQCQHRLRARQQCKIWKPDHRRQLHDPRIV